MYPTVCRISVVCALLVIARPIAAFAQEPPDRKPIGWFAADVRAVFAQHPHDPTIATFLGVDRDNVPPRGRGLSVGAHVYPLRTRSFALGFGGEMLLSRASKTREPDKEGDPEGPTVKSRFEALSPQISANFGHSRGWSYLTAGLGSSTFEIERIDAASTGGTTGTGTPASGLVVTEPPRTRTLNYGGGARWFMKKHLAFTLDLRFYVVSAKEETAAGPALPRTRLVMMSGGLSFK